MLYQLTISWLYRFSSFCDLLVLASSPRTRCFTTVFVFWTLGTLAVDGWAVSIYSRCLDHAHVMTSRSSSLVDWDRVNHAQCRRYDGPEVWCRSRVASVSSSGQRTRDDVMVIPRSPISIVSASFEAGVKLKLHLQFLISKATRSDNPVSLRSLHPVCIQHKITVT